LRRPEAPRDRTSAENALISNGRTELCVKIFDVAGKAGDSGESLLGYRDTGSRACYLVYGVMDPGEGGRELKPGRGHEELVLVLQGELQVDGRDATLNRGQAVHLKGDETVRVSNPGVSQALYVIAGGHSENEHHAHG
jgi:redox-sensitive bicupin YhaK (pirin superfamily)